MKINCNHKTTSSFSWRRLLSPAYLLPSLLYFFSRYACPAQASPSALISRSFQEICPSPRIGDLANSLLHLQGGHALWEWETCYELASLEREIREKIERAAPCAIPPSSEEGKLSYLIGGGEIFAAHVRSGESPSLEEGVLQMQMPSGTSQLSKARNLDKMFPWRPLLQVQIPFFEEISLSPLFEQKAPEFFSHWNALRELSPIDLDAPAVQEHFTGLHRAIGKAFTNLTREDLGLHELPSPLIVRSVGIEDRRNFTNAGANKSLPNVLLENLPFALFSVLSSYFSRASLQNAIDVGIHPFAEDPPLSALLQEYIAEDRQGIPSSFVLFTNEPFYTDRGGRFLSISSKWGPEVVKSGESDTTLCTHSQVYPDQLYCLTGREKKPERLVLRETGGLKKIQNSRDLIERSSLTESQIQFLHRLAILSESIFGEPVDIEGLFKQGPFFVQIRSIHREEFAPTHLVRHSQAMKETFQGKPIVPGKASVVEVTSLEQVLIKPTLEDADREFKQYQEIRLVITFICPPKNSHAVINFERRRIPCFCLLTSQFPPIDSKTHLVACPQTGTLTFWDTSIASLDAHIRNGFISHPAAIAISLPVPHGLVKTSRLPPLELEMLFLNPDPGFLSKLEERFEAFCRKRIAYEEINARFIPSGILERRAVLKEIQDKTARAFLEIRASKEGSWSFLFFKKVLQTLFLGSYPPALSQYSLLDADALFDQIKTLLDYQENLSHPAHFSEFLLAGKEVPSQEAFAAWKHSLLQFEPLAESHLISREELRQFKAFIDILNQSDIASFWFIFFQPKEVLFQNLLIQIAPSDKTFLKDLFQIQSRLRQILPSHFADPKALPKAWSKLQNLLKKFLSPSFFDQVKNASPIICSVVYSSMRNVVEVLDGAIKEMKRSDNPQKLALFEQMVRSFFKLMRSWAIHLAPTGAFPIKQTGWSLDQSIAKEEIALPPIEPSQLFPSSNFNVAAAIAVGECKPETWEDGFMFSHQVCLETIKALNLRLIPDIEKTYLPQAVKSAISTIEQTNWGKVVQRIGIEIDSQQIIIDHNVPLRDHSFSLKTHYDPFTQELTLHAQFFGNDVGERWINCAFWSRALESTGMLKAKKPHSIRKYELSLCWSVIPENLSLALNACNQLAQYTIDQTLGPIQFDRELLLRFLKTHIQNNPALSFWNALLQQQDPSIEELTLALLEDMPPIVEKLQLLATLLKKRPKDTLFIERIRAAFDALHPSFLDETFQILELLLEQTDGSLWAIEKAKKALKSIPLPRFPTPRPWISVDAIRLLTALVKRGENYQFAAEIIPLSIQIIHPEIREASLALQKALQKLAVKLGCSKENEAAAKMIWKATTGPLWGTSPRSSSEC